MSLSCACCRRAPVPCGPFLSFRASVLSPSHFKDLLKNITLTALKSGAFCALQIYPRDRTPPWHCSAWILPSQCMESGGCLHTCLLQAQLPSACFLVFLHRTQHSSRWHCYLFAFFCCVVLVTVLLFEAELNFSTAARHDWAAGSYRGAELAPLFLPNVHWTHWGLSPPCICNSHWC